jgi:hypothetical protein
VFEIGVGPRLRQQAPALIAASPLLAVVMPFALSHIAPHIKDRSATETPLAILRD